MSTSLRFGICALAALSLAAAAAAEPRPALRLRAVDPEPMLRKPARLALAEVPIAELPDRLAEQFSVPAYLDAAALTDAKINSGTKLNCAGSFSTLDDALAAMLDPAGLSWLVDQGALVITSREKAAANLDCRVYRLRRATDFEELIKNVEQVDPKTWTAGAGPGGVARLEPDLLLVLQTRDVQRQLAAKFAAEMRELPHVAAKLVKSAPAWAAQHRALAQVLNIQVDAQPLSDALEKLSERGKLPLKLDERAGVDPAAMTAEFDLEGVRLATGLRRLLGPLGLTYLPDKSGLLITTPKTLAEKFTTVTYPVQDLVTFNAVESIIRALQRTVAPASWSEADGPGKLTFKPRNILEIEQSYDVHCQIEQWFADLRAARKR